MTARRHSVGVGALALAATLGAASTAAASTDRAGRIELTTTSTLLGAGIGLWTSLELDLSPRPAAWISAILAGGMLYGSYTLSNRMEMTSADVRYIETTAGWMGIDHALLTVALETDPRAAVWTGLAATAVGAGVAVGTLGSVRASEGQMSLINTGGIFGPIGGALFAVTFHLTTGENTVRNLLILNVLGLGTGVALTSAYNPTREQVLYLDGGMLLGGLCGGLVGAMTAVVVDTWEPITGLAFGGMALGGYLAVRANGFDKRGKVKKADPEATGTPEMADEGLQAFMIPLAAGRF